MFDKLLQWLSGKEDERNIIDRKTPEDDLRIPCGFFRCLWLSNKHRTRGYKHLCFGLYFDIDEDTLKKLKVAMPTDEELAQRPLVRKFDFVPQSDIVKQVPGMTVVDTEKLEEQHVVRYDGANPGPRESEDPRAALDGCLW